jgi:hypothetical protein
MEAALPSPSAARRPFFRTRSNAVVIATGPTNKLDPLGPWKVDFQGNENLVAAARQAGATRIVLVTSIGVDDLLFPLNREPGAAGLVCVCACACAWVTPSWRR